MRRADGARRGPRTAGSVPALRARAVGSAPALRGRPAGSAATLRGRTAGSARAGAVACFGTDVRAALRPRA